MGLRAVLDRVRELGAEQVELVGGRNVFVDRLDEARTMLDEYDLKPTSVSAFTRLNLATFSDIHRVQSQVIECVDCAAALGAPFSVTYYGVNPAYDRQTSLRLYAEKLKPCVEHAARKGVVLLLENLFDLVPNEVPDSFRQWYRSSDYSGLPDACLELVELVGSEHFGINFDPCNFYIGGQEPYPYAYERLKPHIRNVHLKDARRYDPQLLGADHVSTLQRDLFGDFACVPLGEGGWNVTGLLGALCRDGYDGVLTLEAHTRPFEIMDALKAGVRFIRKHWR